jgi:hypothetical protein
MSKPSPSLTEVQQQMVLSALATLRLSAHDKFLLDLASALARCKQPVSDLDVKIAIRQLLGFVPVRDIVQGTVNFPLWKNHREANA